MQKEIQDRLVLAMKAKDKKHITILRDIKTQLAEAEKLKKKGLVKQDCFEVLTRMAKKRNQSIDACGNNFKYQELKQQEEFELNIIEEYLPTKMTIAEINEKISTIIKIGNISHGNENIGKVMKEFNQQCPNQDGKVVSKIVRETLSV